MRLIFRLAVFGLVDLTLLLVLANYTSWEVALVEVLASGLLGVAVIRYVTAQFGHKVLSRLAASESPGPVLADGAILFVAGILLILPGIISDVAGLLLLIPLGAPADGGMAEAAAARASRRFSGPVCALAAGR